MLKLNFIKGFVCLAPLLSSGIASAALFDYNYTNLAVTGGSTLDSVGMTVDGIAVDVTAYTIDNDGAGNISSTSLLSGGTGVYVSSSTSGNLGVRSNTTGDGTNMDGGASGDAADLDEGLLFIFDQEVRLDFINFDSFTEFNADDFNLTVDGVSILVDYNANEVSSLVTNDPLQFDHYYFNNIVGTEFLIWADGDTDSFRIDEMIVSAVPVPAAVWLFGSGLFGLIGVARKKTHV